MSASFSTATRLLRSCPSTSRTLVLTAQRGPSPLLRRNVARFYSASADATSDPSRDSATSQSKGEGASKEESDTKALEVKDEQIADLTSRLRYAQADFINLQKISAREKEQTTSYAISNFARDLISTVDVLGLALKSVPASALTASSSEASPPPAHLKQLHDGVSMTQRQLLQTLAKYGVTPFDPTGEQFDPNQHEALYEAPVPGKEAGSVIECSKQGYKIKDRILRAAQVGVAR